MASSATSVAAVLDIVWLGRLVVPARGSARGI